MIQGNSCYYLVLQRSHPVFFLRWWFHSWWWHRWQVYLWWKSSRHDKSVIHLVRRLLLTLGFISSALHRLFVDGQRRQGHQRLSVLLDHCWDSLARWQACRKYFFIPSYITWSHRIHFLLSICLGLWQGCWGNGRCSQDWEHPSWCSRSSQSEGCRRRLWRAASWRGSCSYRINKLSLCCSVNKETTFFWYS
jgi:hypothetical protein